MRDVEVYIGQGKNYHLARLPNHEVITHSPKEFSRTFVYQVYAISGLATEPTAQPTNLVFSSLSSSGMTLTWTASAGGADGYLVIRRSGASPTFVPVDQAEYTVSQSVGDGVVAYVGSAVTFADSGLTSDTVYYYDIFAYNGTTGTYNYLSTSPLEGNQYTYSAEPTAQPTSLQFANVTTTSIDLSWTAASPVPTGYIVLRRTGASPTGTPTDSATAYNVNDTIGDSTVEYVGTGTSFTDSGLSDSTTYYYDVMSYNGTNWFNYLTTSPLEGSQATTFAFGNAIHFDGSNDKITTTVNSLLCGNNKASWLFWAKADAAVTTTQYYISLSNTAANQGYLIGFVNSNTFRVFIMNGSTSFAAVSVGAGITSWNFYEVYYDGTQSTNATKLVVKINGVSQTLSFTGTIPTTIGTPSTAKPLTLGVWLLDNGVSNNLYDGWLDELAIYSDANTANGSTMYGGGSGGAAPSTNLVRYYKMNSSNSSTTVTDETGTDNGTLVNSNFDANSGWGAH